jgi:chemotaxis protein CheC
MNSTANNTFSNEDKEILEEIMNIAFGNATADLADVIDIHLKLNVPEIQVVNVGSLSEHLTQSIDADSNSGIVEQKFWGHFSGSGLLVFPSGGGRELIELLDEQENDYTESSRIARLEKGVFLEIGNILIGACVGKISELLNTFATYSPPHIIHGNKEEYNLLINHFDSTKNAVIMKSAFSFRESDINGFLLIIANHDSIGWLKDALNSFMESYE